MPVSIDDALSEGVWRLLTPIGAGLLAIAYVLQFVRTWIAQSLRRMLLDVYEDVPAVRRYLDVATPIASDLSLPVIVGASVALWIAIMAFAVVALRVFAGEEDQQFRPNHYTDLLVPTINAAAGSIVFGLVVGIGFVLFVLPGVFLGVSLWFYQAAIAVDDENFLQALGTSWELTSGDRLSVFVIALAVVAIGFAVNLGFGIVGVIASGEPSIVGVAIGTIGDAIGAVFTQSVTARTFDQLRGADTGRTRPEDLLEAEEDWN